MNIFFFFFWIWYSEHDVINADSEHNVINVDGSVSVRIHCMYGSGSGSGILEPGIWDADPHQENDYLVPVGVVQEYRYRYRRTSLVFKCSGIPVLSDNVYHTGTSFIPVL
jgi:hypothetical protein